MIDTYNGWSNWDTWNVDVWISNDESLYHWMQAKVRHIDPEDEDFSREDVVEDLARELETEFPDMFSNPDGVDYDKVDWEELAEAFVANELTA